MKTTDDGKSERTEEEEKKIREREGESKKKKRALTIYRSLIICRTNITSQTTDTPLLIKFDND